VNWYLLQAIKKSRQKNFEIELSRKRLKNKLKERNTRICSLEIFEKKKK
jgi:hypothetical protein